MTKEKILLQLDSDNHSSSFDAVVAIDAGVDHLLQYSAVTEDQIEGLVHGAMFTRGPDSLKHTAIFIGGSQVEDADLLARRAQACFFGPVRVSLMADPNGSNTTAAAAVLVAQSHLELAGKSILILGATGPVGQRIAQIIGTELKRRVDCQDLSPESLAETKIQLVSRNQAKVDEIHSRLVEQCGVDCFEAIESRQAETNGKLAAGSDVVFAAGAAGIAMLPDNWLEQSDRPDLVVDLNAVPPLGIPQVGTFDLGEIRSKVICYGAIGVGGLKMKIHKACLKQLFESNDQVLLTSEIYRVGKTLMPSQR